jgi:hypothetical protein
VSREKEAPLEGFSNGISFSGRGNSGKINDYMQEIAIEYYPKQVNQRQRYEK